jgi:copper transport protein
VRRNAAWLFIAGVALVWSTSAAQAHAQLASSNPDENAVLVEAPGEVTLVFTEEPELPFSSVEVVGPDGERVDGNDLHTNPASPKELSVTLAPGLGDGIYTVLWRALSAVDGHRTRGNFAFFVGEPPQQPPPVLAIDEGGGGPPTWASVASRWLTYSSFFALLGFAAALPFVLAVALRRVASDPPGLFLQSIRWLAVTTVFLLVTSALLALVIQSWAAGSELTPPFSETTRSLIRDTRFGETWIWRSMLSGLACLFLVLCAMRPTLPLSSDRRQLVLMVALLLVALGLPATLSLNSHAAAHEDFTRFATFTDWLHLTAGGLWVGGLLTFVIFVSLGWRLLADDSRLAFLSIAIPRFSFLAVGTVAALVGAGIAEWWILVGDISATLDSLYGRYIIVKALLLLPMLALGAVNLLLISPALRRRVAEGATSVGRYGSRFAASIRMELLLGAVILVFAALLSNTSPPSDTASGAEDLPAARFDETQVDEDVEIRLRVDPAVAGANEFNVLLDMADDSPDVREVVLRFTYLDDDIGTTEDEATQLDPEHYSLSGGQLSLAGSWEIEVLVRRFEASDARATFAVDISASVAGEVG